MAELPNPKMRSPSQWPGTARSAASAGRWLIMISGAMQDLPRPRLHARGTRSARPVRDAHAAQQRADQARARRLARTDPNAASEWPSQPPLKVLRRPLEPGLHPPVAMVHETATLDRPALVQGLLKRVEHEAGVRRPAHPPADDAP